METQELNENLIKLGLTAQESRLYTWLVENIQATGYEASTALKLPRGTAYTALEALVQKGIVRSSIQNKKRVFFPESFKVWQKMAEEKMKTAAAILPILEQMAPFKKHNMDVRIYKGAAGLQKAWDEVIEHYEQRGVKICYAVSHGSHVYSILPKYFPKWIERRVANKTHAQLIYPLEDREVVVGGQIPEPLTQYKFAPGASLAFSGDVTLGGRMTAIFSMEDPRNPQAVIIESEEVTKILTQWFRMLWQMLPGEVYEVK